MLRTIRPVFVCLTVFAGLSGIAQSAWGQSTALILDSQPGDYIGGGQRAEYTLADATFTVARNHKNGVSASVRQFDYGSSWYLDFGAGGGAPLAVGSYRGARRFAFASFSGLDVSGSGRDCSTLTGRFDVLEVEYDSDGTVVRFAADFEQHCEDGAAALFGAIRYNSTISDTLPFRGRYPTYDLTVAGAAGGVVTGEHLNCGNGGTDCFLTVPVPSYQLLRARPDPGYQLLEWAGDCDGGEVISIHVNSSRICAPIFGPDTPNAPRSTLLLDSQTGDYIGAGVQGRYTDATASWSVQTLDSGNSVQFTNLGADDSRFNVRFRAPGSYTNRLTPGDYPSALRAASSYPEAGIDVYGNGRGCGTITGRFIVYEVEYNSDNTVARFAGDFAQHCESSGAGLFGSIRFNSMVPGVLPFGGAYPSFRVTGLPALHGRVTGGGMNCGRYGRRCTVTQDPAGPLTLTAIPDTGYTLSAWVGDCSGSSLTTVVQVDTPTKQCSARFVRLVDTTPPVLQGVPANQRIATTSAAGADFDWYLPGALDDVDGSVGVTCAPPPGTTFPIGTTTVTCSAQDASGNRTTASFTVTVTRRVLGIDLNADTQTDLLWRSAAGEIAVWMMNGQSRASTRFLGVIPPHWRIAAAGDFTSDGNADLVWQEDTGMVVLWEMQGTTRAAAHVLFDGHTSWRVAAAGDVNGDGHVDLVWQSPSGSAIAWLMQGMTRSSSQYVFDAGTPWRIVAAGDLDGDGFVDLVWQHPDGAVVTWLMNGLSRRGTVTIFGESTDWRVEGIVNLNNDSHLDFVWQSPSGTAVVWLMNGVSRGAVVRLYEGPTDWRISGPR